MLNTAEDRDRPGRQGGRRTSDVAVAPAEASGCCALGEADVRLQ